MLTIRLAEEAIAGMVESGEARCPCHLGIGQEAVAVGLAEHIRPSDRCFGAHRSHSHYLALGGSLDELIAEILGKVTGCSRGYGGSMHLRAPQVGLMGTVPIVAATIPIATGAALAAKLDGRGDIAVSFLGDGATEEGVFHESLNLASSMSLPVLFVVENNLYSSHLHIDLRQPNDRVARFGEAHAIETRVIDGNDVTTVSNVGRELIDTMRTSPRPFLIEAVTYRWRGHVGHREDMDVGVERTDNLPSWKKRDPIARLEESLGDRGLAEALSEIREALSSDVARALEFARSSDYPDVSDLLQTVYAPSAGQ
ncbi:MAG: thiamine pyrophosphate-dependent dehydrogenase E1 component subunit alpha [Ilumatobacteraceae bacterium]